MENLRQVAEARAEGLDQKTGGGTETYSVSCPNLWNPNQGPRHSPAAGSYLGGGCQRPDVWWPWSAPIS